MWGPVSSELLRLGLPGIVILGLVFYVWVLHRELRASERARVEDAQATQKVLLDLNTKWSQALEAVRETINAQSPILERLEDIIREVKEALRNRR